MVVCLLAWFTGWAFLGDVTKWVPQSPKRFTKLEIEYDGDDINAKYTFQGIQVRLADFRL